VPAVSLFRTEDPVSLAERFDELLLHPDRLAEARAAAFRLGQEQFNWEKEQRILLRTVQTAPDV